MRILTTSTKMRTLDYDLSPRVRAFTTTHAVEARRTHPLPLSELTGLPLERIVIPHQVHDTRTLCIDTAFLNLSTEERAERLEGIDAVMTSLPETLICISTADCIPIIIYDARQHVAAAIHAGWKGTVRRIAEQAFAVMQQTYDTQASDCHAVIGPGISLECFEVGDEVYERFTNAGFDMKTIACRFPVQGADTCPATKWHIDLKLCNHQQLIRCGFSEQNIQVSDICTMSNPNYFSARREGPATGRNMTCITLNPKQNI